MREIVPALSSSDCVLAVFSASAQLLRSRSGGPASGLRGERWSPPRPQADGTVSAADVVNWGLTVCLWASCNAQQRGTGPRLGPAWRSPDNHPSPNSSCTAHSGAELGPAALPWASPGWCRVVLCREDVIHAICKPGLLSVLHSRQKRSAHLPYTRGKCS